MHLNKRFVVAGLVAVVASAAVVGGFIVKSSLVKPSVAPLEPYRVTVEHEFAIGDFVESVLVTGGRTYVAAVSPTGAAGARVWIRNADGSTRRIDGVGNNLAATPSGRVFATTMNGQPTEPQTLELTLEELIDGRAVRRATFERGALINGLAFSDDDTLYAADSLGGCIWQWTAGSVKRWRVDPLFAPASLPGIPGINGLRVHDGALWTVNSSTGTVLRVPLDGSAVRVVATGIPGDGFDIDGDGTLSIATHPFNTIERLTSGGVRTTLGTSATGIFGPTDVQVLPDGDLLVLQDGGAFLSLLPPPIRLLFPDAPSGASAVLLRLHAPDGRDDAH